MTDYNISFKGNSKKPVSYSPNTGEGPPFKPMTVSADTIQEAAQKAKDWYIQDLAYNKANGLVPACFLMEEDEVGQIILMSEQGELGLFDFETLTNSVPEGMGNLFAMFGR